MYFTENRYDRSIEWMMKGVPNFYPRGSGIVVTGKFEYTAEISFGKLRPKNCSEYSYPLYCAAKDLYLGTRHITINDLADNKLINAKTFALICNAMAIRKYGLGAIQFTDEPKT